MQFSFRTAIVLAAFCAASLVAAGTPGLAIEPDKSLTATLQPTFAPLNADLPKIVPERVLDVPEPTSVPAQVENLQAAEDQQHFESLAAAIAAQPIPAAIDDDLACLAGTIYFESKGEPLSGQLAVAQVVINRTESGRFPRSICSVVKQRGQFSFVRGGQMPSISSRNADYRTALAIAQVAMGKAWDSKASGALFFHASSVAPAWRLTRVAAIGRHVFYR